MKVAIVVQRYGADISGGAELHARYIAEHLARHVQVEVLTTCASDYITWRNERPEGMDSVNGVPVRRFPVARERVPKEFGDWSTLVFDQPHSVRDELAWLDAEGPTSPALVQYIQSHAEDYDFFVFFSFRYYHSFHGVRAAAGKAILVPTAERDGALGLSLFPAVFRAVRAIMYNSWEERALINAVSGNADVPGVVVGVGSDIPERTDPARFRQKFDLRDRFAIYVGRIDENKGCKELFDFFEHYSSALVDGLHLVLIGTPVIEVPRHPRIHHLGFVTDEDKFDAIAASELLIMPSYFESLSMVALEAWALGKPVLANAACDVLHGQCLRSNAGLFYNGFQEFFETLRTLDGNSSLAAALGQNGRTYFQRHYTWPVIERTYTDMLDRLRREPATAVVDPLPGWWARRRRVLEPANAVVARLPMGAAKAPPAAGAERPLRMGDAKPGRAGGGDRRPAPRDERRPPDRRGPARTDTREPRPARAGTRAPEAPVTSSRDRRPSPEHPSPALPGDRGRRQPIRGRRRTPGGR
ncbi:MAG: glycosyltransferase family 4 protein [Acidobacteria bacterium]|nr:glycosyltransferase family 4 protein [Acidobacteriota bacterium]